MLECADVRASLNARIRLAREKEATVCVVPTTNAINESVELAHEMFNWVVGYSRRSLEV
jgi:hypothetical protein